MDATTSPNPSAVTQYHWVLTVQYHLGGLDYATLTHANTVNIDTATETRGEVFSSILAQIQDGLPLHLQGLDPVVLCWTLAPNTL